MEGTVIRSTGSWYNVQSDQGPVYECRIRGGLRIRGIKSTNPVAVGDHVTFKPEPGKTTGVISEIAPRRNYIIRRSVNLSKRTQIIAANIDRAFLMATIDFPETSTGFIDRFLASAEAYHIPVTILFNKTDLYDESRLQILKEYHAVYEKAGYPCIDISVETGANIERVKELMKGKISTLSGHSGVGKSSLINAIEPSLSLKTSEISMSHFQGQHTTTFAEMFPLSFSGYIIDTPGIRGFGLVDMDPAEAGDYFPEIFALKGKCRFNNCLHVNEPDCAVLAALEKGEIAPSRYLSYLSIIEGDETPYRQDIYL